MLLLIPFLVKGLSMKANILLLILRMQNAKKSSIRQWCHAYPINPKKTLGPSVIHSMPGAQWRAPNLPIRHPPTYAVQTYQQRPSDQRWMAKLSYLKQLLHLHRTVNFFCNFHSVLCTWQVICSSYCLSLILFWGMSSSVNYL